MCSLSILTGKVTVTSFIGLARMQRTSGSSCIRSAARLNCSVTFSYTLCFSDTGDLLVMVHEP